MPTTTLATQSAYLDIVWETRADGLIEGRVSDQRYAIKQGVDGSYSAKVLDPRSRTGWKAASWGHATIDAAKGWCQTQRDDEMSQRGEI